MASVAVQVLKRVLVCIAFLLVLLAVARALSGPGT